MPAKSPTKTARAPYADLMEAGRHAQRYAANMIRFFALELLTEETPAAIALLRSVRSALRWSPTSREVLGLDAPKKPGRRGKNDTDEYIGESMLCAVAFELCGLTRRRMLKEVGRTDHHWIDTRIARGQQIFRERPDIREDFAFLRSFPEHERKRLALQDLKTLARVPKKPAA
jgi:hypothetical protein